MPVGLMCAWERCVAVCEGPDRPGSLPPGWIYLATYYRTAEPGALDFMRDKVERDAVLCPEHNAVLERLLKRI